MEAAGATHAQDAHEVHPPEAHRIVAQCGSRPVVARGRRVAFAEDEVDHAQHRRQPLITIRGARNLERHPRLGQSSFGADDPLRDRGFRNEKRPRDLVRRQAAQQAKRESNASFGR